MARTKEYNYDEVLEIYKKLSNEKGKPLKYREVNACDELPSIYWFQKNGGIAGIRNELGFNDNTFCNDCTKWPSRCGHVLEECPFLDDSELYFTDTEYNSSTELIEEKNKETRIYSRTHLSNQKLEEAIKLKKHGMVWKDIAIKFGIKKITLYKKVQRYMGDDWENRGWR